MRTNTRTTTTLSTLLLASALGGCFIPFVGMGGGSRSSSDEDKPRTIKLEPVTYQEMVSRAVAKDKVAQINRDLTVVQDPMISIREADRVNFLGKGYASSDDSAAFPRGLAYAGIKDGMMCWLWDQNVGGKGDKRIFAEAKEAFFGYDVGLYAVDDLSQIQGATDKAIPDATQVAWLSLLSTDLDAKDERYALLQTCALVPNITARTTHLVMTVVETGAPNTTFEPYGGSLPLEEQKQNARFAGRAALIWKLVGNGVTPATDHGKVIGAGGAADGPGASEDAPGKTGAAPGKAADKPGKGSGKAGGAMKVAKATVAPGAEVRVEFDGPMKALPGEKYWITIVAENAGDTSYNAYEYLPADATGIVLAAPTSPGKYEVRLHGNYPTKTYNLLLRTKLIVR